MKTAPNQNRKIIYGLVIVALFGAMLPYSQWLNREKSEKDLGEAAIGQVDTGSFMLKLALLGGARGMAANVLWTRAEELKRDQDWDRMKATVDLITKLQPHFLSVWTFQGWNLAYNVSVEWDAPEDKYEWIKQGIKFLQEGVDNNRRSPDLVWDTAWTYYHKLGFSDESIILRRLFYDDDDTEFRSYIDPETGVKLERRDNFQLGYGWFSRAVNLVDEGESRAATGVESNLDYVDPVPQRKGRPGDLAFRTMPAHSQTRYAERLEKMSILGIPATFGEVAKNEWAKALAEWVKFGMYEFPVANYDPKDPRFQGEVRLDDSTNMKRFETLNDNQKYWTIRWSDQMNYRYWKERSQAEKTDDGVRARQNFYEGTLAYRNSDFDTAAKKFKEGLTIWDALTKNYTAYRNDDLNRKDTGVVLRRYLRVLGQQNAQGDTVIPQDLPFKELMEGPAPDDSPDPFDASEMLSAAAIEDLTRGRVNTPTPAPVTPK
jgi:hypothetical protein